MYDWLKLPLTALNYSIPGVSFAEDDTGRQAKEAFEKMLKSGYKLINSAINERYVFFVFEKVSKK